MREDLKKTIGTISVTIFVVSVFVTVVGILITKPVLRILSTPEEAFAEAVIYLVIVFLGTIFTFGYNLVSSILRGMGDSKHPLIFVAIAAVTNLVLVAFWPPGTGVWPVPLPPWPDRRYL